MSSPLMNAAIYEEFGGPIRVQRIPVPRCPEDGILVQVMATGVCRSDWHGWKGHDGDIKEHGLPFCPGHEFSGVVVETGNLVRRLRKGDRVAVPFILSCGDCRYCLPPKNQPTICSQQIQPGFTQFGSYAEYVVVPRADRNVCHMPDAVTFVQAAALGCRFTTAYRALYQQGQLVLDQDANDSSSCTSVGVFGCGGVGLSCIMLAIAAARKKGQTPIIMAVDVSADALEMARSLGATHTVQVSPKASSIEISQAVKNAAKESFDGLDITLDAAGFITTSEAAVYSTRPGGRMVQVGLPFGAPAIPMGFVAGKEITIVGSHGFDGKEVLPNLLHLVQHGIVDPNQLVRAQVTLEQGCAALEAMDRESPLGMVVITDFTTSSSSQRSSRL